MFSGLGLLCVPCFGEKRVVVCVFLVGDERVITFWKEKGYMYLRLERRELFQSRPLMPYSHQFILYVCVCVCVCVCAHMTITCISCVSP